MYMVEEAKFGVAYGDRELPVFSTVLSCQSYCTFPIDQAGDIGSIGFAQLRDRSAGGHP